MSNHVVKRVVKLNGDIIEIAGTHGRYGYELRTKDGRMISSTQQTFPSIADAEVSARKDSNVNAVTAKKVQREETHARTMQILAERAAEEARVYQEQIDMAVREMPEFDKEQDIKHLKAIEAIPESKAKKWAIDLYAARSVAKAQKDDE
jgi:hypothetical protein